MLPGFVDSPRPPGLRRRPRRRSSRRGWPGSPTRPAGSGATVAATRAATDDELRANLARLVAEMAAAGHDDVECKSGYGLTVADEERAVAHRRARSPTRSPSSARTSCPASSPHDPHDYVELVTGADARACAPHARWIDVFCERGAFDADQTREILEAGRAAGLLPRLHANQLGPGPGVRLAVELGAASADHCTHLSDADVDALAGSETVATLLPGVEFSTRSAVPGRPAAARRRASTVALATDCNPGSCYTSSMAVLHRAGRARDAHDPGRGGVGRHRGRGTGAAPQRRRQADPRAPAPTSSCWTPRRTSISPTARASPRSPPSGRPAVSAWSAPVLDSVFQLRTLDGPGCTVDTHVHVVTAVTSPSRRACALSGMYAH